MKPKFPLGQRLWPIVKLTTRWNVNPPFDFLWFFKSGGDHLYSFTLDYGFIECDVFDSASAAQAECDRRNGGAPKKPDAEILGRFTVARPPSPPKFGDHRDNEFA